MALHPPPHNRRLSTPKRFGDLLRKHRLERGFSQERLAEKAGISSEAIGALERGTRRAPYRSTLVQISIALELDEAQSRELEDTARQARSRLQAGTARARPAPNNLPAQVSSFVGREQEVEAVRELVKDHRHVTLIGVGGIGKTRIALNAAVDLLYAFEGVWFIDFAPFNDASLLPIAILSAVNVPESPRRTPLATIITFLKTKHVLLIFDNCEHVIDDAAAAAQEILLQCPPVHVLATSRELLGIPGEKIVRVPTLSVPALELASTLTVDDALRYGAVALFVDRAKDADSRFEFTQPLVATIAEICFRLDGIALAIELAAARVNVLSVSAIARKLDEHFSISIGGKRTAPPRHRTMRALLDWSYELLDEREQRVLRKLSVFAGSFTLELATALFTGDRPIEERTTLDFLGSLVDKSLVQCDWGHGTSRYRLLEPIRQYAGEKLRRHGENDSAARAHMLALLALVESFPEVELHFRSALGNASRVL